MLGRKKSFIGFPALFVLERRAHLLVHLRRMTSKDGAEPRRIGGMRMSIRVLCFLTSATGPIVAGLLAGCGGSIGAPSASAPLTPVSIVPAWMQPAGAKRLHLYERLVPAKKLTHLIYAVGADGIAGYPDPNEKNEPPTCTLGSASNPLDYVDGFGTDAKGNVTVPYYSKGGYELTVFGPNCGKRLWSAPVTSGQPADAYAANAASTSVLVGELADSSTNAGALIICSKSGGCGAPFSNSAVTGYGGGVAMAKDGDCWLSAEKQSFSGFVLVYFKGCAGSGTVATGTLNTDYGGLFIDTKGNLGSIDLTGKLYVYNGCTPACKLLSTSTLEGESIFSGLDKTGREFVVGDYENSEVDVYSYSPANGATYSYSFNNGLSDVEAAHFAPALRNK